MAVTAQHHGTCVVCAQLYFPGAQVGLVAEGWAHLDCAGYVTEEDR